MRINVSHVRAHLECPAKAFYQYDLRRSPRKRYEALDIGTLWHGSMAELLTGSPIANVIELGERTIDGLREKDPDHAERVNKGWTSILPALREWVMPPGWEVIEVEKVLERRLRDHLVQGTLDAIVKWNGSFWHLQHKTVAASRSLAAYYAYMERDWHECVYQWLIEPHQEYQPYAGTILNTVRKLSAASIEANPSAALAIQYIPRPQSMVDKAILDFGQLTDQISMGGRTPQLVIQNRSACGGTYGNSVCPYIGVCNKEVSLYDDSLFEDAPDRYQAPLEAPEP